MTAPENPGAAQTGASIQTYGRQLLMALFAAGRALSLYPLANAAVQNAIGELDRVVQNLFSAEGMLELRLVDDFLFLNDTRLRIDVASIGAFASLTKALNRHGIGLVEVERETAKDEWPPFLSILLSDAAAPPFESFTSRLKSTPVSHIKVEPERVARQTVPDNTTESADEAFLAKQAAKRTYMQSVNVAREVLTDVRLARAVNVRRVKHAIQAIVDQVLVNENAIVGMTVLRDMDEYSFTHSVNVSIFSVVLGQKLGLSKPQLYELGVSSLFHDLGKMRTDPAVLNKQGKLTSEEWAEMQRHPVDGLLALFSLRGFEGLPYRAMLVAYEHHMKMDQTGYPSNRRPRKPTLFSRITAVADGFDAGTSSRSYQYVPLPPDKVLREMRDDPKRGYDPLLVKALINVTGVYPPGTLAILDTMELAVVVARNPDPAKIHQPLVKIISTAEGAWLSKPESADLSASNPETGLPLRRIIKTTDPERYGIDITKYVTT